MATAGDAGAGPLLSIIIVNWNTRDLLLRALATTATSAAGLAHEVVVVDNGSTDGSVQAVRDGFPAVRLIENGGNVGFAAANNQGLAIMRGRAALLLNSDAAPEPAAIPALWAALWARPGVAVVGPRLHRADGSRQHSRRGFPDRAALLLESTPAGEWWPGHPSLRRFYAADAGGEVGGPSDWLEGACLLVRAAAIAEVGPLDGGFFFYAEEVEWQWRLRRAGWGVWYEPAARVLHDGGASGTEAPARYIAFQAGRVRLARRMYGRAFGELVRAWLLLCDAGLLLTEAAKGALGHKRALRRRRAALWAAVLRSGLVMPGQSRDARRATRVASGQSSVGDRR